MKTRFTQLVAGAVTTILLLGACSDDDDPSTATSESTTTTEPAASEEPQDVVALHGLPESEDFVDLEPGAYFVDPDGADSTPLRVTFEVAGEGWSSWIGAAKFGDDGHVALSVASVTNLVRDACVDHQPAAPAVGPTVDDLATALAQLAPFEVSEPPSDVTMLGYAGKHLQLTVPDLPVTGAENDRKFADCSGGALQSWIDERSGTPFYGYNGEPGRTEDFWILDVGGTRVVIETTSSPASPPEDLAELQAIVDSVRIET